MSGFDLAELMPFYLDETDEHIAGLNDALLLLEQSPDDAPAMQSAFRMFHSIKGASIVMGFQAVNRLAHHLESLFDQFRKRTRALDRAALDLAFRCLDELRDYHRDLRARGQSDVDLSGLTADVEASLSSPAPAAAVVAPPPSSTPAPPSPPASPPSPSTSPNALQELFDAPGVIAVTVELEPGLPLADMKARLVVNRLSARARVLGCDPPLDRLDEVGAAALTRFLVFLAADCAPEDLRGLADVEGVLKVGIEGPAPSNSPSPSPSSSSPAAPASSASSSSGPTPAAEAALERAAEPAAIAADRAPDEEAANACANAGPSLSGPGTAPVVAHVPAPGAKKAKVAETIRVESERLDHLMNLAGELVINRARFVAIQKRLDDLFRGASARENGPERVREAREQIQGLAEAIHGLGRISDGLQKGVLDTRMVPIGPLFERFRRVVRDLGHASGKEVVLAIDGEKTELDKRMIDELSDPLIHMVRNAVDHGLERPEERERAGKPRAGTISLLAAHRGNSVVITVSDDGRGLSCERIRSRIVEHGIVSGEEARALNDRELAAFIWHPGLSTAETVTDVSGRGVGMDIVKARIENLSGTVDVRTASGRGTTFNVRLPLTLAIMSSLLVRIYDETYAIALDHIDEILEIRPELARRVQGRPAIEVREKIVMLIELGEVFQWGGGPHPSARAAANGAAAGAPARAVENRPATRTVVIVQNGETTIGLLVDELIGMQEVVLKSLEKNFQPVAGLSGASILGDGRVSLVLDLDAVLDMVSAHG